MIATVRGHLLLQRYRQFVKTPYAEPKDGVIAVSYLTKTNLSVVQANDGVRKAVPEAVVELVRCKSSKECKTSLCDCRKVGLSRTDACVCNEAQDCENRKHYNYGKSGDGE